MRAGIHRLICFFSPCGPQEGAEEYCVAHAALFDEAAAALLAAEKGAGGEDSPAGQHKVTGDSCETAVNRPFSFCAVALSPITKEITLIEVKLQPRLPPAGLCLRGQQPHVPRSAAGGPPRPPAPRGPARRQRQAAAAAGMGRCSADRTPGRYGRGATSAYTSCGRQRDGGQSAASASHACQEPSCGTWPPCLPRKRGPPPQADRLGDPIRSTPIRTRAPRRWLTAAALVQRWRSSTLWQ
jgi:hypothetical protein